MSASHRVAVTGGEIAFLCGPDETVLDAAERGGFALPYSCRKGVCASCEGELVAGSALVKGSGLVVGPVSGVKLCQARPVGDIEIAPKRIGPRDPAPRKRLQARVFKLTRPTADVAILKLRYPNGVRARFRAGQHLKITLPDGDRRSYSMANPPQLNDGAELHIRDVAGGRFSEGVLAGLAEGLTLEVETPFGEVGLSEGADRPLILVVTGTGFAPAKSIIEDHLRRGSKRPLELVWGGRRQADLYQADLAEAWTRKAPHLRFTPVLSQPDAGWTGRTGWVQQAVLEDHPDLSAVEVYACGNPLMTDAARKAFVSAGLAPEDFHCDAFVPSGDETPA